MSNYHHRRGDRRDDYEHDDQQERYARTGGRSGFRSRGGGEESDSRSQSPERRHKQRRRDSYSRSRSRSPVRRGGRYSSRRHRDSRSRSRTPPAFTHGRAQPSYRRNSRSPARPYDRHRRSRSRNNSSERRSDKWYDQRRGGEHPHSLHTVLEAGNSNSSSMTNTHACDGINLENLPLPKRDAHGNYYNMDMSEPFDKERIHREMEEKLRAALAKEGKVYPPPKPEASHPVFANDGSFIEIFKKMQEAQKLHQPAVQATVPVPVAVAASTSAAANKPTQPPPPPMVGRRRGGKILKTGLVAKPKVQQENNADPKDFWSLYLAEVNKYKNNACESDGGTRPLVK